MNELPLVSIIIPVFNKEKWITQTLRSVSAQTYENWECLIIDDGSSDRSADVINDFVNSTPGNWKVFRQSNMGQAPTRNKGIKAANGDLVAFLDGDDYWLPNKLQHQVDFLLSRPEIDALISGFTIFELGQNSNFREVNHHSTRRAVKGWLNMRGFGGLIESTGIIKRPVLEALGGFNEDLSTSAGLELSVRLLTEYQFAAIPHSQVLYRLSNDQWHKNEVELRKDLDTLVNKFGERLGGLGGIQKWHDSYFYWSKASKKGKVFFLWAVLSSILRLKVRNVAMLYSLVSRNLIARYRGRNASVDI